MMLKLLIHKFIILIVFLTGFSSVVEALPYRSQHNKRIVRKTRFSKTHKQRKIERLYRHRRLHFYRKFAKNNNIILKKTSKKKQTINFKLAMKKVHFPKIKKLEGVQKLPPRQDANKSIRSLASVYEIAKKRNLDLKMLRQRLIQANLMKAKAWAALKPTLQLQGNYTRNQKEVTFDPTKGLTSALGALPLPPETKKQLTYQQSEPTVMTPLNQLSLNLRLNWNFFNLQTLPLIQSVYLGYRQIRQNVKQTKRDLLFTIARAYYNTLLADGLINITRRAWLSSYKHYSIALERYNAGLWTEVKVMRAKLDVVKAHQNWLNARNSLNNMRLSLAALLNLKEFPYRSLQPSHIKMPTGNVKEWLKQAHLHRLELKTKRLAIKIAHKKITQVWMKFFPTVALGSAFRMSNSGGFSGDKTQWNVSLTAKFPIYLGGSRYVELRENHSKLRQAQLDFIKTQRNIDKEVKQVALNLSNAKATLRVARTQLKIAERTHELYQQRYRSGLATPVAVSDAQTQLMSAQISYLRVKLNLDLVLLALQRAIGAYRP